MDENDFHSHVLQGWASFMDASDLALLVTLGAVDSGACRLEEITAIARSAAPLDWQPTTDVILAAVETGIGHGWLIMIHGQSDVDLRITASGREKIIELLGSPISRAKGSLTRAAMSVKLSLLHHLPQPTRSNACLELAYLYRDVIAVLGRPHEQPFSEDDHGLPCERVRLQSELAWLDAMTVWRSLQQAAE